MGSHLETLLRNCFVYAVDSIGKDKSVKEKSPLVGKGTAASNWPRRGVVPRIQELFKSNPKTFVCYVGSSWQPMVDLASPVGSLTVWLPSAFEFLGFCVPAKTSIGHLVEGTGRNLSVHRLPLPYFIPSPDAEERFTIYMNFATGKISLIAQIQKEVMYGFSVSPDERTILYTQVDQEESDLMLVENFR
jgi:hypothetical protein